MTTSDKKLLADQVAAWEREIARLSELVAHATGKPTAGQTETDADSQDKAESVTNHIEAYQLAVMKQGESNLARCYLELIAGKYKLSQQAVNPEKSELKLLSDETYKNLSFYRNAMKK